MKKLLMLAMSITVLTGCADPKEIEHMVRLESRSFCSTTEIKNQVADFTLSCISNANPKSDEEPEDWIKICKHMAVENFCEVETVKVFFTKGIQDYYFVETGFERLSKDEK